MAIKANLVVDQGVDYYTTVTLTDDNGDVVNLGSYDITSQMRKTYTSSNAVSFTTAKEANNGVITLSLTASQTANIVAGRYVYDVFMVDSLSNVHSRIVEGIVTVTPRVTR